MAGERIEIWRRRNLTTGAEWEKLLDLPLNSADEEYIVRYYDGDPNYQDPELPDLQWRL